MINYHTILILVILSSLCYHVIFATSSHHQLQKMSDNYQNYWGRFLFKETKTAIKQSSHETSTSSFNRLKNSFEVKCDPFKFINTFSSGTQALQWCMTTSTFMRINQLLIACGSYISGDNNSVLTHLGTSAMIKKYGSIC